MQSAEDWAARRKRIRPALFTVRDRGASLSKAKCVRLIIVASARFQNPVQMCLARDDDVVHTPTPISRAAKPFARLRPVQ